eukprot:CAMPEP_0182919282 /NCGR_PEP_ID=MMETSP0105_2-20130417/2603_1 /TAXON_ID=81532 ORGANISM="Acanthoeca-like sp., Strain 10tr" /NCGR_SAMPLE_ID=MMETSP0105_2 /ASSEMBLY_ACC=CAM_ASM_000205 /LENGTH=1048 /DNA_ID=CAMNT_0025056443 /DNA_START=122 /DNA_END=3270 /DNA_ORIENTATION=-
MSKFWEVGDSSSDDESDIEEIEEKPAPPPKVATSFAASALDDDDDVPEESRIVLSKAQRNLEQMAKIITDIKNKLKIGDWEQVEAKYKDLNKQKDQNKKDLLTADGLPPKIYVRCVTELEDVVAVAWKGKKSLKRLPAKALTGLRSAMRKHNKEHGYEEAIIRYRDNPDAEDEAEEAAAAAVVAKKAAAVKKSAPAAQSKVPSKPAAAAAPADDGAESDDSMDWGQDDDDDDDDDLDFAGAGARAPGDFPYTAEMFLKKKAGDEATETDIKPEYFEQVEDLAEDLENEFNVEIDVPFGDEDEIKEQKVTIKGNKYDVKECMREIAEKLKIQVSSTSATEAEKRREAKRQEELRRQAEAAAAAAASADLDDGFEEIGKAGKKKKDRTKIQFSKDEEITVALVMRTLLQIVSQRGKKGTKISDQQKMLRQLRLIALNNNLGEGIDAVIHKQIISSHFDNIKAVAAHMEDGAWRTTHDDMVELVALLDRTPHLRIGADIPEEEEVIECGPKEEKQFVVRVDLAQLVERLDDENIKALQETDSHSLEYVARLRFEVLIYNLIVMVEKYLEKVKDYTSLCRVKLRRVTHLYYKRKYIPNLDHLKVAAPKPEDAEVFKKDEDTTALPPRPIPVAIDLNEERDLSTLMNEQCKQLFGKKSTDRIRTRAILMLTYHHALHERWYKARDLMLMSHLQETVHQADVDTQILYNRTMVQLGLCAFRQGLVTDAWNCLHEIHATTRVKELLAQGIVNMRNQETSPEQILIQKRRQTPFHMHINIDMMECVYFACSMLIEIPAMAQPENPKRRFYYSKKFGSQLNYYMRNTFVGPPETNKEHLLAASLALLKGDWRQANEYAMALRVWKLFPKPDEVTTMLTQKIKESALRVYLYIYSGVYETISLVSLSEMFEMEQSRVHSIVSKMIFDKDLQATHDQPTQTIEIHEEQPSLLQTLALKFADKGRQYVESTERLDEAGAAAVAAAAGVAATAAVVVVAAAAAGVVAAAEAVVAGVVVGNDERAARKSLTCDTDFELALRAVARDYKQRLPGAAALRGAGA